ncbi:bifunctional acetate--CoA ligase family protein/GNAT family N-acetyltransferase [Methylococcus sp. EFPC2]|uniref:bifunctional acetate--CoA ligase family protein/GNAT family N-acetyltransferase n=1 Tax=Methylococcus sp. EFPC2 TaxID=2812648 RepID=UPI0019678B51|nr:bifunctional acetate--CoA ligase family protein/GNAT family N-acetyltransferase [Methylococcus sp. EFPC2]QSA97401.1 bifunctional acetate--CoA ligase family protein/GNAT family N-acetyltransferase [Methylococcus sp. EFPC2]
MGRHYLEHLFTPRSIAVFGASPLAEAVGGRVYENLLNGGFAGPVHAINPKYQAIGEKPCYASLDELNERVDLAIIATPAATTPAIIRSCGEHQIKAAIVLSAGFGELEGAGKALEHTLLEEAHRSRVRLLGPNCLGLMRTSIGMNATFSNNVAKPGSLALVSQSGAICTAILDWASAHEVGFSTMVSVGDAADVSFGDILDYLSMDPETRSILMYIEGVRDARRFMSGLRAAARLKPVIVIKAGRHAEGSRAAMSHTGSLVGSDDVFDAALERAGVVRADTIEQLFAAAQLLSNPHRIGGNRLAIITNAGGPGVMATDRAVEQGIKLAELSPDTRTKLDAVLPKTWSHNNPVDILGDATPERYQAAVEACLADDQIDGLLVMLTPQAMTAPTEAAKAVIKADNPEGKPVLACWLGETQVRKGRETFARHHVPSFINPESALEAFGFLAAYRRNQELLMQAPGPLAELEPPDIEGAKLIIEGALAENRTLLSALETRALLRAFSIPMLPAMTAHSPNEALAAAEYLGFPVALKILSPDITHKSDVGGVRLNVGRAQAVRHVYSEMLEHVRELRPEARLEGVSVEKMYRGGSGRELLVGVIDDPVFGPVVSFGAGGVTVEILQDRAVALPPLNDYIARSMIRQTHISRLLEKFRNLPPADLDAIVHVLLRVSEMVCELPQIKEMDINPLTVDESGAWALDARIVVQYQPPGRHPYDHMAIHPYPSHLVTHWQMPDGVDVTIRPIRPEDAEMERDFVRRLSPEAKYFRFMETLHELSREMLIRFTQLDYSRELAFIAVVKKDNQELEVGVARYFSNPDGESGEIALVVADDWQSKGIGTRLMTCVIDAAREKNFHTLQGEVLANNVKMLHLMSKLGFTQSKKIDEPGVVVVTKPL